MTEVEQDLRVNKPSVLAASPEKRAARPRSGSFWQRNETRLLGWLAMTVFLVVWELLPALGLVKPLFISSPSRIVAAAKWLFAHGFWYDLWVSATEFGVGLGLAALVGVPLGVVLGWSRRLNAMCDWFVSALYATPRVALLPLIILWLGIGRQSIVAVVFLGALFPILVNTATGVRTIDETLLLCVRSFGAKESQILTTLALPSSVPMILTGMRLAVGRALVGVVVGEMVASRAGIGHMMSRAGATFQTDKLFVGVVVLAISGYVINELLKRLEAHFESWRPTP